MISKWAAAALLATTLALSCSVDLGDTPARCSATADGAVCPEGYVCIHDVCAKPGKSVPITVTTLQYLRATDLRLVPQTSGVLVAWEIYNYDAELHDFAGARIAADGSVSKTMKLVAEYPADSNYLEPYFDALAISDTELLVTMGAAPVDYLPESRLTQFAVHLPASGSEASDATSEQRWELRMPTVGYGAVSQPKLIRTSQGVSLAYFESEASDTATAGSLATFELGDDGARLGAPACHDPTCCQANECTPARQGGLPIAVSVVDAFAVAGGALWIVDDTRPSFLHESFGAMPAFAEGNLPRLSVPIESSASSVLVLQPSARTGTGLPDDPAEGPASLYSVASDGSSNPQKIADLPGVRDTPRPAWISRSGAPALLVTPGLDVASPALHVYAVDSSSGATQEVASIDRFSTLPIAALRAAIVGDSLYVVWLDVSSDTAAIRGNVIPAP